MTVRIDRDQVWRAAVWEDDGVLRDRVVLRVENRDTVDIAVVLGEPDLPPIGRDPVRLRVGARRLEVSMGVGSWIEGADRRAEMLGVPDAATREREIPGSTPGGNRPLTYVASRRGVEL